MTTLFTVIGLIVAGYRIRKGLFTKVEWLILCVWLGHFAFEELQLITKFHHWRYDPRYFRPADFLTWGWAAWGMSRWWRRTKWLAVALLVGTCVFDLVLVVKPKLPFGRRGAYVRACDWAVERIRADWKGPARDTEPVFSLEEYHTPYRPAVFAHVARVPYLLNGRQALLTDFGETDYPDYWIIDTRRDDPPPPDFDRIDTFRQGKFAFELYRRNPRRPMAAVDWTKGKTGR